MLLPRFVDYVVWNARDKGRGRIEVALYPSPLAFAPDMEYPENGSLPSNGCGPERRSFVPEYQMG